jgi:hypothetical protein
MKKPDFNSRRKFIGNTMTAFAGLSIIPSHVMGGKLGYTAPSDKLNIAGIGIGGRGKNNLEALSGENIVALCDVDWQYAEKTFRLFPQARKYWDYRKMLDEMGKSIDAVVVATADHTHAIIAADAITLGKHAYVQKPLTHSIYESRLLVQLAKKYKVATQMGNQANSAEGIRRLCEMIWSDIIGEVREVKAWTNRPKWPQGLFRPTEKMNIPSYLNWDLFLGPAPERPYHPRYTPWNWRGWWDFGVGALGDMGCHILDPVQMALRLENPKTVQASSSPMTFDSHPQSEIIEYVFPAREKHFINMPEVKVTWYDGGLMPFYPEGLKPGDPFGDGNGGLLFIGDKGMLQSRYNGGNPGLIPDSKMESYVFPPEILKRIELSHEMDWVRACKESPESRTEASSHFGYSGQLTETVLLGVLAVKLQGLQRRLEWNPEQLCITNMKDTEEIKIATKPDDFKIIDDGRIQYPNKSITLNAKKESEEMISHTYRTGWTLPKA